MHYSNTLTVKVLNFILVGLFERQLTLESFFEVLELFVLFFVIAAWFSQSNQVVNLHVTDPEKVAPAKTLSNRYSVWFSRCGSFPMIFQLISN